MSGRVQSPEWAVGEREFVSACRWLKIGLVALAVLVAVALVALRGCRAGSALPPANRQLSTLGVTD